jgi:hypothetical protein
MSLVTIAGPRAQADTSDAYRCDQPELILPGRDSACLLRPVVSVLLIYALLAGPQRHAELRRRLPGITQKVLTETLRGMESDGLVERRVLKDTAPSMWNTP